MEQNEQRGLLEKHLTLESKDTYVKYDKEEWAADFTGKENNNFPLAIMANLMFKILTNIFSFMYFVFFKLVLDIYLSFSLFNFFKYCCLLFLISIFQNKMHFVILSHLIF